MYVEEVVWFCLMNISYSNTYIFTNQRPKVILVPVQNNCKPCPTVLTEKIMLKYYMIKTTGPLPVSLQNTGRYQAHPCYKSYDRV